MKKQHLLFVVAFMSCLAPTVVRGQSLGLNFATDDPATGEGILNPTDVAGFFPQANWNNLTLPNQAEPLGGLSYRTATAAVNRAAMVTWSSPNTWRSTANNSFPAGPNRALTTGYLDSNDTAAGGVMFSITGIDAALRTPAYDVFVYMVSDSPADRGGAYTLTPEGGTPIVKYGSTMAAPTGFVEDPGTDINNSIDGTFLRFAGLTAASFTLTSNTTLTTPNGFRAPVNAIQIVAWSGDANNDGTANLADYNIIRMNLEKPVAAYTSGDLDGNAFVDLNDFRRWTVAAPPELVASVGIPEPSTIALGLAGALLLARFRRHGARLCAVAVAGMLAASPALAAVTMTYTTTAPTPGPNDQFNFQDDATIPGGTAPGDGITAGGTYNSQAFSDNNGPPGQTFTTPTGSPGYNVTAIWLKGASAGSANFGGNVFGGATTWSIRLSQVQGTTLTPLQTYTAIPTIVSDGTAEQADGDEWYTWTFTGADIRTLGPNTMYAFDLYSSAGYLGFDAAQTNDAYANGFAFNSGGGAARSFAGVSTGNLANHNYDRTFLLALAPSAAPPPGPGDVNQDGVTNLADYEIIKTNFFLSSGATRAQGDLTLDGRVDLADFTLWRNNAPLSAIAAAGVPEPAAVSIAALAAALLVDRGRICRQRAA